MICTLNCPPNFIKDYQQLTCSQQCQKLYFADFNTGTCVLQCSQGYYGDYNSQICFKKCPGKLFADDTTQTCVSRCPLNYFGYTVTNICQNICNNTSYYGDPITQLCTTNCTLGLFADSISKLCVTRCPYLYFSDPSSRQCRQNCYNSQYYMDDYTNQCVTTCNKGYFANTLTKKCVSNCPENYFGDFLSVKCVTKCPIYYYGDPNILQCSQSCPLNYFRDNNTNLCSIVCSLNQYGDYLTQNCTTLCHQGSYGNNITKTCVTQCPYNSFGNNITRLCQALCPVQTFGDDISTLCLDRCPDVTTGSPVTWTCEIQCPENYYQDIITNVCGTSCPMDYYGNPLSRICELSCPDLYLLDSVAHLCVKICTNSQFQHPTQSICTYNCPENYFGENSNWMCLKECLFSKFADSVTRNCTTLCSQGYFGNPITGLCSSKCSQGWFSFIENRTCHTTCPSGLYGDIIALQCILKCPFEFYGNSQLQLCVANCPASQYGDPSTALCQMICSSGYFGNPITGYCVTNCPKGYYGDSYINLCVEQCSIGYYADQKTQLCTKNCSTGTYGVLDQRICTENCPTNLFKDPLSQQCQQNCTIPYFGVTDLMLCMITCPQSYYGDPILNLCTQNCSSNQFIDFNKNQCVTKCPSGFYGDFSSYKCITQCINNQFADPVTLTCVTNCPNKYFGTTINNTKQCVQTCPAQFFGDSLINECVQQCFGGYYASTILSQCVQKCPTNYYGYDFNQQCLAICPNTFYADKINNKCVQNCTTGLYADPISKSCVNKCPNSLYADNITGLCVANCSSQGFYRDSSINQCVNFCSQFLFADQLSLNCVPTCPDSFQPDSIKRICNFECPEKQFAYPITLICVKNCLYDEYYEDVTTWRCVKRCPIQYYADEQTHKCTIYCPENTYGEEILRKCVPICPNFTFANSQLVELIETNSTNSLRLCLQCFASCKECKNQSSNGCLSCKDKYYMAQGQCLPCYELCSSCTGNLQSDCTACNPFIILHNGNFCTQKCLEFNSLYPNYNTLQCLPCHSICQNCTGPTEFQCTVCKNGLYLSNSICYQCISPCINCFGPQPDQCITCISEGYFFLSPSSCIACPDVCLSCKNSTNCLSCVKNRNGPLCNCSSIPYGVNYYPQTQWCGSCEIAILDIQFSANWTQIIINFGLKLDTNQFQINCQQLFKQETFNLIGGANAICKLNQTTNNADQIIITLNDQAKITLNQQINLMQNYIVKQGCIIKFNQFEFTNIKSSKEQLNFQFGINVKNNQSIFSQCEQIQIFIDYITNDGNRGLKFIQWTLVSINPIARINQIVLNNIIDLANQQQNYTLDFPNNMFISGSNYTFQVYAQNYFLQNYTQQIIIQIQSTDQQLYCKSCLNQTSLCTDCLTNTILREGICTRTCAEFPMTYPDLLNLACNKCDFKCTVCKDSTDSYCFGCIDNYYLEDTTCKKCHFSCYTCIGPDNNNCNICNEGFYKDINLQQCLKCPEICKTCTNQDDCQSCNFNREGIQCQCPLNNGVSYIPITYWCGTCEVAILNIYFSKNWQNITIDFGLQVMLNSETQYIQPNSQTCQLLFDQEILNLLGSQSNCSLNSSLSQIIINLEQNATINIGQQILFNNNSITKLDCQNQNYSNFIFDQLKSNNQPGQFNVSLKGPNYKPTVCEYINIQIGDIINDGLRGLKNLTWSLQSINPSHDQNLIDAFLDEQNQNQSQILNFPNFIFQEHTEYIFQLYSYNYFEQNYTAYYTLQTTYSDSIKLILVNTTLNPKNKFFRYETIQVNIQLIHLKCIDENQFIQINDSLQYQWEQIEGNKDLLNLQNIIQLSNPEQGNIVSLIIPPYTTDSLVSYAFNFTASLPNTNISKELIYRFNITQSEILVRINGGSRTASINQQLTINGWVQDKDLPPDFPNPQYFMNFTWLCEDLNLKGPCYDIKNQLINMTNNITQTFQRKLFQPYKSYKFTLIAQKGERQNQTEIILMFLEVELPQLAIEIPPQLQSNRINLQDQIYIQMKYTDQYNPDTLFYSSVLIYDYDEVAVMIFDYLTVRFRIWEHFTNFNQNINDLTVRFSVYNPLFIMPSQISFTFKVNIVPQNCILSVQPTIGSALSTDFEFNIQGCEDQDTPFVYKFYFYNNIDDQQKELKDIIFVKRNTLNDYNDIPQLITQLPQGLLNYSMQTVIMASIKDSAGGIANITLNLTINQNPFVIANNPDQYLLTLNQIYQQSKLPSTDFNTQLRLLSIIVIEFTNSQFLDSSRSDFIILQKLILDDLYIAKNLVILDSSWDQQISYLIGQIMLNSKNLFNVISSITEINSQIQNVETIIQSAGNQLQIIPIDSNDAQQALKMDSILTNCAIIIDGLLSGLNNNLTKDFVNQTNNDFNKTQDLNHYIINLTQLIATQLVINTLPNENPKTYNGKAFKLKVQQITTKNLINYLGNEQINLFKDEEDQQIENITVINNTQIPIYKVAFKKFIINPYNTDQSFPYLNQSNQVIDPGIFLDNFTQKINLTKSITHYFNLKSLNQTNLNNTNNGIRRILETKEYQVSCASLQINGEWKTKTCDKIEQRNSDGYIQVKCICKDLSIATAGEQLVSIFTENKNLQTVLSQKGIQNLSTIEFYKYAIFYIGASITLIWLFLTYYGYMQDNSYYVKNELKEGFTQITKNQDSLKLIKSKSQIMPITSQIEIQTETNRLQEDNQQKIQNQNQNNQEKFPQLNQQFQAQSINQNQINSIIDCENQQSQIQKKQEQLFNQVQQDKQNNQIVQDKITIINDSKQNDNNEIQKQNCAQHNQQSKFKLFLIGVSSYHEFFSIFYIVDQRLSRPIRFTIYYIRIIFFMALTSIFSQSLTALQTIILSAISGIGFSIVIGLLSFLLKSTSRFIKFVGILVLLGICGVCWYSTLVIAATVGVEDSNIQSIQFFLTFLADNIVIQIIVGSVKYSLIIILINNIENQKGLLKNVNIFVIKQLMNQRIKEIFEIEK